MLRKAVLCLAVLSVASMAFAVQIPIQGYQGHVKLKFTDVTHLYRDGQPLDMSLAANQNPVNWVGAEVRSIFNCYSLGYVDENDVFHETWSPVDTNEQITGVFHNTRIGFVQVVPLGPVLLGLTLDGAVAPPPPPNDLDYDGINGTGPVPMPPAGGRLTLYVDNQSTGTPYSTDPSNDGDGTDEWGGMDANNRLAYPGVTDGALFADLVMTDMSLYKVGVPAGTTKIVTLNVTNRTGQSEFMLNSIDPLAQVQVGPLVGDIVDDWAGQQSQWSDFPNAIYGDAHGLSNIIWKDPTTNPEGFQGWFFQSEDPIDFAVIVPEPTTCLLLGGAVIALVRRRRRK